MRERPLDVLRHVVVVLDPHSVADQLRYGLVVEHLLSAPRFGHGLLLRTTLGVDSHDLFIGGIARDHTPAILGHDDVVGSYRATYHRLSEAPGSADDRLVPASVCGIGGKHHTRGL